MNVKLFVSDYSFPYLIVVLSVISCAAHFAVKMDQSISSLIVTTLVEPRNILILIGHWCLHAYGIISITQLAEPKMHALMIFLVPLPALFYVLTAKFTDPHKDHFQYKATGAAGRGQPQLQQLPQRAALEAAVREVTGYTGSGNSTIQPRSAIVDQSNLRALCF